MLRRIPPHHAMVISCDVSKDFQVVSSENKKLTSKFLCLLVSVGISVDEEEPSEIKATMKSTKDPNQGP
jgi:hypothetical protein